MQARKALSLPELFGIYSTMKILSKIRDRLRLAYYRRTYDFANTKPAAELNFSNMRQIVICKIDGKLGDTEVISPLFAALKKHCPQICLTVLTSAALAPIYRDFLYADKVFTVSRRPAKGELDALSAQIGSCDLCLTLEADFRFHDFYLLHKLRPAFIAGVNLNVRSININLKQACPDCHLTAYFAYLLHLGGINDPCCDYISFADNAAIERAKLYCKLGQIMFAPWGASKHKHLTDSTVLETAEFILNNTQAALCLMVPPDGAYLHELLRSKLDCSRLVSVPAKLSITDLAAVCSLSSAAVSVDTAYVHLACAAHISLFAIYNGNKPELTKLWGPVPGKSDAAVFSAPPKMIDELSINDFKLSLENFLLHRPAGDVRSCNMSEPLNNLKTYVISLPHSTERRTACMQAAKEAGLSPQWFEAVNGKQVMQEYLAGEHQDIINLQDNTVLELGLGRSVSIAEKLSAGELGCSLSHLKVYQDIVNSDADCALILEDDCKLFPVVKEVLPAILANKNQWDIVQLLHDSGIRDLFIKKHIVLNQAKGWYLNREGMGFLDPVFNRRRASYLACAYIVTKAAAQRLIDLGFPVRLPADYLLGMPAYHKLRMYCLYPKDTFGLADGFSSTIAEQSSDRPKHRLS